MVINKQQLVIIGAGGHAQKVAQLAKSLNFNLIGYISTEKPGTIVGDLKVLGYLDYYKNDPHLNKTSFHIAIGENSVRYDILSLIQEYCKSNISIFSPAAKINSKSIIRDGTSILTNVVIENNAYIGKCCLIDTGAIIEHDTEIGDFVNVSPGAIIASHIKVGMGAIIGAGATVIEKISIGEGALVGAGSVVINDIEPYTVVVGNPARKIRVRNFNDRYFK